MANEVTLEVDIRDDAILIDEIAVSIARVLKKNRVLYRPYISVNPDSVPGGYRDRVIGQMPNTDGDLVGMVRFEVYVPSDDAGEVIVYLDWTRDIFGFWYREIIRVLKSDISIDINDVYKYIKKALLNIQKTSNGSVRVRSMNLGVHKKVKKNRVRDSVFENGMKIL